MLKTKGKKVFVSFHRDLLRLWRKTGAQCQQSNAILAEFKQRAHHLFTAVGRLLVHNTLWAEATWSLHVSSCVHARRHPHFITGPDRQRKGCDWRVVTDDLLGDPHSHSGGVTVLESHLKEEMMKWCHRAELRLWSNRKWEVETQQKTT